MARSDYYIPVFDSLPGHKKEQDLREAMGWNGFESVGFLVWFWLRVAADFPDGELPGLDELTATLKRIWKAAGFKPIKRERLQLVAETLQRVRWVDVKVVAESAPVLLIHDWEEGAGMFAVKREYEKNKKRRQREEARGRAPEPVPGTPADCPCDVPGENRKEEKENIPPYPPRTGGEDDFQFFEETVFRLWGEECEKQGRQALDDPKTILGRGKIAKQLQAGTVTEEQLRLAMRDFLRDIGSDAKKRDWDLNTLAKKLSSYLPKKTPPGTVSRPPPAPSPEAYVLWYLTCDACGREMPTRSEKTEKPLQSMKCPHCKSGTLRNPHKEKSS